VLRWGRGFANYGMALQAALDGVGVAIGLRPYVEDDVAAGRLVAPFSLSGAKGQVWYLVYRLFREADPGLIASATGSGRISRESRRANQLIYLRYSAASVIASITKV
jgi:hypothetical protein